MYTMKLKVANNINDIFESNLKEIKVRSFSILYISKDLYIDEKKTTDLI